MEEIIDMRLLSFIGIHVPDAIAEDIRKFQSDIPVKHESNKALEIPVHITLIPPFYIRDENLEDLITCLSSCRYGYLPFEVRLDGFGTFPPRVVYVQVDKSAELAYLQKDMEALLKENAFLPPDTSARDYHPHVTIASKSLSKKIFAQAWSEFNYKKYAASWMNIGYTRYQHIDGVWQVKEQFTFQP